ncbi:MULTISPECIES: hypothetical protein [Sphingobacterium]|uniref:Uncharacterized protein n=1 Tax=Sphingobacterium kitahiroshimense TaxID=470446 RepID=A0ABV0BWM8_9SPHI|nr:hypothetical protein [Sphingobacterium faecium]MQP28265.1 hypothetical protein [Sphingobacterium faecium]
MAWFRLTGSNPTQASHYTLFTGDVNDLCPDNEQICAIQALNDGNNNPDITTSLRNEMIIALNNQAPSTNVLLKLRP